MKLAALAVAAGLVGAVGGSAFPPPTLTVPGSALTLAAAGPRAAFVTSDAVCTIRIDALATARRPVSVKPPSGCREGDIAIVQVWIGRSSLAALTLDSPSPHGDSYALWTGPLPRGPLRRRGDDWGWTDSDVPPGYGCAWTAVAGGGAIALEQIPNRLAADQGLANEAECPAGPTSRISLIGAARPEVTVAGAWRVLATDGRRLALARTDADGAQTGQLELVDLTGRRLATPSLPAAVVRTAFDGWLTTEGLVVESPRVVAGPGWALRTSGSATVAEGRVLYEKARTIRVRRVRGGPDRLLLRLPPGQAMLAAGSFGLAITLSSGERTRIYRIPWRTIDRTLPAD